VTTCLLLIKESTVENEDRFRIEREEMVRSQIERRDVRNPRVLTAMRRVPRHAFVPTELQARAYEDGPLPIGQSQTISQPYIVAAMSELLELNGTENVLEIGTGSGYQAAVLGELARSVHSVERHAPLAEKAAKTLAALGYNNISVHVGDGSLGRADGAPYQAVLVTAAAPEIPRPLVDQLGEGGRLVIPVGDRSGQMLERWRKVDGTIRREKLFPVAFVPLRGTLGWQDEEWE
jgi:protein-L-isoaspartate(D-aspartate) O-methyltransferase